MSKKSFNWPRNSLSFFFFTFSNTRISSNSTERFISSYLSSINFTCSDKVFNISDVEELNGSDLCIWYACL